MDGLKTQESAVPSKDWVKKTEETNRDKRYESSSRNCEISIDLSKTAVENNASSIDNHHSTDLAMVDLQTQSSYKGNQKSIDLLRIAVETGLSTTRGDQHSSDLMKIQVGVEPPAMINQHSRDLMKVEVEAELSTICGQHYINVIKIEDEAELPTTDDKHSTDLMKIQVGVEPPAMNNQHSRDLMKLEVETELSTICDQHSIEVIKIEDEAELPTTDDQHSTDSMKMEAEHSTVDGQQKTEGERESSHRHKQGPIKWVRIETQPFAGDNQNSAKLVKMEDAKELSSEFTQDSTDLVKLEVGKETCSEVCQDSSCLMKFEEEDDPLVRDCLVDVEHVKTEEGEGPFHDSSPGLIKWVMFETEEHPFSRDSQDCEKGEGNENSAVQCPKPGPPEVQNEVSPQQPALVGRLTRRALRDVMIQITTKEKDARGAAVKPVCLRHPSLVFSGGIHCNGVARMIMLEPGSPLLSRNVKGQDLDLGSGSAVEDQCKDATASRDSHEDDPCSSDTESADETETPVSPSTDLPMIASVFSLRGTEEEKLHTLEHQESEPHEEITCNSELPLITSVFTLRGTEEEALHPTKHQESELRRDINCSAGEPAVSLLIIGNVLQPLTTPLNTQKGDPDVPVMITRDELQPVMPTLNNPEGVRVSEPTAGGTDPSVKIVLNKLKDLTSPPSTQKQKRIAEPDAGFPMITSVFTLRDTEEEELHPVDNQELEGSENVNFDSGIPMITAVFTLRDEEEEDLQPVDHRLAKRREKVAKRKESMAQDSGNIIPEGSRKMKYSAHYQVGPGPYTCSVCGISFDRFTPFRKHQATHKDLRLHKCSVCGDTFDRKFRLLDHKKRHAIKPRKYMPFILPKPTF